MGWMQDTGQRNTGEHWDSVFTSKSEAEHSWTQKDPAQSLALVRKACPSGRVIDIGGGTSPLAARLLEYGYSVTVLDISEAAIASARGKLEGRAEWIVADVTTMPKLGAYDVWHDRAVFHFLIDRVDRAAYLALLKQTVPVGRDRDVCIGWTRKVQRTAGPAL